MYMYMYIYICMYIHASLRYFIGLRPTTTQKPGVQAAAPTRYNRYAEFAKARVKKIAVQRLGCLQDVCRRGRSPGISSRSIFFVGMAQQNSAGPNPLGKKWGFNGILMGFFGDFMGF